MAKGGNKNDAEVLRLRKELDKAQQDMQKMAADREQILSQVAKSQQETRNASVEKERLSSQLEMLVNELSNQQVREMTQLLVLEHIFFSSGTF